MQFPRRHGHPEICRALRPTFQSVVVAEGSRPQPWSPQGSDDEADSTGSRQGWEVMKVVRESVICSRLIE